VLLCFEHSDTLEWSCLRAHKIALALFQHPCYVSVLLPSGAPAISLGQKWQRTLVGKKKQILTANEVKQN
jgi:hypothetical protein